jgi:hypothetical protein
VRSRQVPLARLVRHCDGRILWKQLLAILRISQGPQSHPGNTNHSNCALSVRHAIHPSASVTYARAPLLIAQRQNVRTTQLIRLAQGLVPLDLSRIIVPSSGRSMFVLIHFNAARGLQPHALVVLMTLGIVNKVCSWKSSSNLGGVLGI